VSSFWLHGEEGGAPSIITPGHHCFIVRAAADADIIAEEAIKKKKKKRRRMPWTVFHTD